MILGRFGAAHDCHEGQSEYRANRYGPSAVEQLKDRFDCFWVKVLDEEEAATCAGEREGQEKYQAEQAANVIVGTVVEQDNSVDEDQYSGQDENSTDAVRMVKVNHLPGCCPKVQLTNRGIFHFL
jgi:hypothetical protein